MAGTSTSALSQIRRRLIDKGLIYATEDYGHVEFTIPRFDEFMRRHRVDSGPSRLSYAVLIYERVAPGELPPEVMAAHGSLPDRIAQAGGRTIAGLALQDPSTATSIRDGLLTDGPFIETKEVLGGIFMIEARDLDHALELAKMAPIVDGGVEVRPLIGFQVLEDS
jgi:hypothetical protein